MENINRKVNQIIVEVNYKVELIGLLITLSDESNT